MNNQKFLISLLVILALFGFIACSLYIFYMSFSLLDASGELSNKYLENINSSLIYVTSGLTGLVGGIVATAFGVKKLPTNDAKPSNIDNYNFQNLGLLISYTSSEEVLEKNDNRGKYGFLYALSYIIIGLISMIIWIYLGDNTIQSVSNMATTFFGMMIPIVASYFKN